MLFKIFKFLATRIFILYLLAYAGVSLVADIPQVIEKAGIRTLNRLRPETLTPLLETAKNPNTVDSVKLVPYAHYYETVAAYIPNLADANGLAGYVNGVLGHTEKAIQYYQQAIAINPHFFWFHHNLGMLYYRQGDYDAAIQSCETALQKTPEQAFLFVKTSERLYLPIILSDADNNVQQKLVGQMRDGYRQCQLLIVNSYAQKKMYPEMLTWSARASQAGIGSEDEFLYYASVAAFELQQYQQSLALVKSILAREEDNYLVLELMAKILEKFGQQSAAQTLNQRAGLLRTQNQPPFGTDHLAMGIY